LGIFSRKIPDNRCYVFFLQEKIAEGDSMTQRFLGYYKYRAVSESKLKKKENLL
jgi:hypothetical protein